MVTLTINELNQVSENNKLISKFMRETFNKDLFENVDFDNANIDVVKERVIEAIDYLNYLPGLYGMGILAMIQRIKELENDNIYCEFGERDEYFNFVKNRQYYLDNRYPGHMEQDKVTFVRKTVFNMMSKMALPKGITLKISDYEDLVGKINNEGDRIFIRVKDLFECEKGLTYCVGGDIDIFRLHLPLYIIEVGKKVHLDQFSRMIGMIDGDPEFEVISIKGNSLELKETGPINCGWSGPASSVRRD